MPAFRDAAPILQVADVERSLGFYRDLLGFEVEYSIPEDGEAAYVSLAIPGGTVGLAAAEGPVESASTAIWVYCDDVDAAFGELRDAGVEVCAEPADQPWGERLTSVRDPDGYTIHIAAERRP